MKISNIDLNQIDKFLSFNKRAYPLRKNIEKRFQYQIIDNPFLEDKNNPYGFFSYEDDKITGQFLINSFNFHFFGRDCKGFLACDFYVSENHRGECGAILALKAIRSFKPYFAIGVTEIAKKIHLSLGTKILGSLNKFIWLSNIFSPIIIIKYLLFKNKRIIKPNKTIQFPQNIITRGVEFKLINYLDSWTDYHWDDSLEFSRSLDFLSWRFFGSLKGYYFYLSQKTNNPFYFVVRKSIWKGLLLLLIVDYKIPYNDINAWQAVLKSSKLLAKMNSCDGVLTFSSHRFFDNGLKKSLFLKIGNPNLILTNFETSFSTKDINKRNSVFATMADSDTDFNFDESYSPFGL